MYDEGIIKKKLQEGASEKSISQEMHCSVRSVHNVRVKHAIPLAKPGRKNVDDSFHSDLALMFSFLEMPDEIQKYRLAADSCGLSLRAWARRVLRYEADTGIVRELWYQAGRLSRMQEIDAERMQAETLDAGTSEDPLSSGQGEVTPTKGLG